MIRRARRRAPSSPPGWPLAVALLFALGSCKVEPSSAPPASGRGGKGDTGGTPASELGPVGPEWFADWTMLIFAANDDASPGLVRAFDQDMDEIRGGLGGSAKFRILVQRDYAPASVQGVARPSERFGLYREQRFNPDALPALWSAGSELAMRVAPRTDGSGEAQLLGETDTSDPDVLGEFLEYGIQKFPAQRYWIVVTGHGDGWAGLASDVCAQSGPTACAAPGNRSWLSIDGLGRALGRARAAIQRVRAQTEIARLSRESLSDKIDVLQFDACHMASLEVATALRPYADHLIATQEVMPNAGHAYSALRFLAQDRTGSGARWAVESAAKDYVRSYVDGVTTRSRDYAGRTVSSIGLDLNKLDPLLAALRRFADAVHGSTGEDGVPRADGFSCLEVARIVRAARARANIVTRWNDGFAAEGRATPASNASVDLPAFFEAVAGPDNYRELKSCALPWPDALAWLGDKNAPLRLAARQVLAILGRPHVVRPGESYCGVYPLYGRQYRALVGFGDASPFVVEAHRLDPQDAAGDRATSLSLFYGIPWEISDAGRGDASQLTSYQQLVAGLGPELAAWARVIGRCTQAVTTCQRGYDEAACAAVGRGMQCLRNGACQ